VALSPRDGSVVWEHRDAPTMGDLHQAGVMTTKGGLVFAADDQLFYALDTRTGQRLWSFQTGARINASPISYAVDGTQYVLIAAGRALISFALMEPHQP